MEEHRAKGGDTEVDISYQYLGFFLEDDEVRIFHRLDLFSIFIWICFNFYLSVCRS